MPQKAALFQSGGEISGLAPFLSGKGIHEHRLGERNEGRTADPLEQTKDDDLFERSGHSAGRRREDEAADTEEQHTGHGVQAKPRPEVSQLL